MGQGRRVEASEGRRSQEAAGFLQGCIRTEDSGRRTRVVVSTWHLHVRARQGRARAAERGNNEMHWGEGGQIARRWDSPVGVQGWREGSVKEMEGGRPALQGIQNAPDRV